ncbi:MAG: ABC transporter substrate-binding protein [Chloroflexota bacterium]|jgi:ABC-type nitrate/sulfonate/bicarbonate transport system substrate-binding protein
MSVRSIRRVGLLLLIALLVTVLAACGDDDNDKPSGEAQQPANLTQTSIQFSWVHNVEFAGFYAAEQQGYYRDAGLEVRLDGGGFDESGAFIDPVQAVLDGKADFGVTGAHVLLAKRAEGAPIVAIATIYQRSPVVLIALSESGITRPQDLIGRRVSTQPTNATVGLAYDALLAREKIDRTQIQESMRTDFTSNPLFTGEAEVLAGFVTTEGVQVRQRDPEANFIMVSDYGIDIYSNVIFTTEDLIASKPDMVRAFLQATLKGTQWAVEQPDQTVEDFLKSSYGQPYAENREVHLLGMQSSIPLLVPAGGQPGMMEKDDWAFTHKTLLDLGLLAAPLDVEAAYTLDFLGAQE